MPRRNRNEQTPVPSRPLARGRFTPPARLPFHPVLAPTATVRTPGGTGESGPVSYHCLLLAWVCPAGSLSPGLF